MKEHVSAARVANQVLMGPPAGVFLLVEGGADARVYGKFIDRLECRIIVAQTKSNVLGALDRIRAQESRVALGIVDADFMVLDGSAPSDPDVIVTDLHDLEAILLASTALEIVLHEYGADAEGPGIPAHEVRKRLLELGLPIGLLRWLSQLKNRGWNFADMDFDRFIDDKALSLLKPRLLRELQECSRKGVLDPDDVWPQAEALASGNPDPWHVCCGHDLVALLAIGLRRLWGSHPAAKVTPERIESSLRIAYTRMDFAATGVHARLRAWEQANAPKRILNDG